MFNQLKTLEDEWSLKTPKQKWQLVHAFGRTIAEIVGTRVYTDMKYTWYTNFGVVSGFTYFSTVFYGVWYYYRRGDILRGLQCTCTFGIVVTIVLTYIQTIGPARFKTNNLINFGGKYIYTDDKRSPKFNAMYQKMSDTLIKQAIIITMALLISYGIYGFSTLYVIIFQHVRVTFLGTEIPFYETDTDAGYVINFIEQLFQSSVSMTADITIHIAICLAANAGAVMMAIIHLEAEELETELKMNGMGLNAISRVRSIIMKVHDFNGFIRDGFDVYYQVLFFGPFMFVYSISFSIFSQMILGYSSGYGCALCNYILLLVLCFLGEMVKQAKERLAFELYDMPWYLLTPSCQKNVATAIHSIQNGTVLTMGPFGIIDLENAADLTKSIYRFTMLLFKLFK